MNCDFPNVSKPTIGTMIDLMKMKDRLKCTTEQLRTWYVGMNGTSCNTNDLMKECKRVQVLHKKHVQRQEGLEKFLNQPFCVPEKPPSKPISACKPNQQITKQLKAARRQSTEEQEKNERLENKVLVLTEEKQKLNDEKKKVDEEMKITNKSNEKLVHEIIIVKNQNKELKDKLKKSRPKNFDRALKSTTTLVEKRNEIAKLKQRLQTCQSTTSNLYTKTTG